jgi:hypothetical protein
MAFLGHAMPDKLLLYYARLLDKQGPFFKATEGDQSGVEPTSG